MGTGDVESVINRSLGLATSGAAAAGKTAKPAGEANTGNAGTTGATGAGATSGQGAQNAEQTASPAARVTLSSRALPKTIVNSYEKVELSARVPEQIPVSTMKASGELASTMLEGGSLSRNEQRALREDRVLAAITGMRILQQQTGELQKIWCSGVPSPTPAELEEAYRRLTQRLSNPADTSDLLTQNAERVGLLEAFRTRDFSGLSQGKALAA